MFGKGKKGSRQSVEQRVASIKALSEHSEVKKKKKKGEDIDSDFYKLLNFLNDEAPECRIAAAEALGKTSRDVAFTHISHKMNSEKDENVIKAMRSALSSIRENMRIEHAEKD